jgi:hypothetical protein
MNRIAFGGDVFCDTDASIIDIPDLKRPLKFFEDEIIVANLEGSIQTENKFKAKKVGYRQSQDKSIGIALRRLGISVVNYANNHSLDYGCAALAFTRELLEMEGISPVGVENAKYASLKIQDETLGERSLCVIGATEFQNTIDGAGPAINSTSLTSLLRCVQRCKLTHDYVIITLHAGDEWSSWPSPRQQEFCRSLAEAGASAVVCHHSHAIRGMEIYKGCLLFYGVGHLWLSEYGWDTHKRFGTEWGLIPVIGFNNGVVNYEMYFSENTSNGHVIGPIEKNPTMFAHFKSLTMDVNNSDMLIGIHQEVSALRYSSEWARQMGWRETNVSDSLIEVIKRIGLKVGWGESRERLSARQAHRLMIMQDPSIWDAVITALQLESGATRDYRNPITKDRVKKSSIGYLYEKNNRTK